MFSSLTGRPDTLRPGLRGSGFAVVLVAALGLAAASAWAASITGSGGVDLLRGTANADRIDGRGGDDRVYGLGGNDVLLGGRGDDLLVGGAGDDVLRGGPGDDILAGGPGADRISCGPGHDVVVADSRDVVSTDCRLRRPAPPHGTPPPRAPVTPPPPSIPPPAPQPPPALGGDPGSYRGAVQGNYLFFDVLPDRSVTNFRANAISLACDVIPGIEDEPPEIGFSFYRPISFGDARFPLDDDGSFASSGRARDSVDGRPRFYTFRLSGGVVAGIALGTIRIDESFDDENGHHDCSSGNVSWRAART